MVNRFGSSFPKGGLSETQTEHRTKTNMNNNNKNTQKQLQSTFVTTVQLHATTAIYTSVVHLVLNCIAMSPLHCFIKVFKLNLMFPVMMF